MAVKPTGLETGTRFELALKLMILGGESTSIPMRLEVLTPAPFETVKVYVVGMAGEMVRGTPLKIGKFPGVIMPVPLLKTAVSVVELPTVTVAAFAEVEKLVITGFGSVLGLPTLILRVAVACLPMALVTVRV